MKQVFKKFIDQIQPPDIEVMQLDSLNKQDAIRLIVDLKQQVAILQEQQKQSKQRSQDVSDESNMLKSQSLALRQQLQSQQSALNQSKEKLLENQHIIDQQAKQLQNMKVLHLSELQSLIKPENAQILDQIKLQTEITDLKAEIQQFTKQQAVSAALIQDLQLQLNDISQIELNLKQQILDLTQKQNAISVPEQELESLKLAFAQKEKQFQEQLSLFISLEQKHFQLKQELNSQTLKLVQQMELTEKIKLDSNNQLNNLQTELLIQRTKLERDITELKQKNANDTKRFSLLEQELLQQIKSPENESDSKKMKQNHFLELTEMKNKMQEMILLNRKLQEELESKSEPENAKTIILTPNLNNTEENKKDEQQNKQIEQLNVKITEQQKIITDQSSKLFQIQEKLREAEEDLEQMQQNNKTLTEENKRIKMQNEELQIQINKLNNSQQDTSQLNRTIEELNDKIKASETQITVQQTQNSDLQKQYTIEQQKTNELNTKYVQLEKEMEMIKSTEQNNKSELETCQNQLNEQKLKVKQMNLELSEQVILHTKEKENNSNLKNELIRLYKEQLITNYMQKEEFEKLQNLQTKMQEQDELEVLRDAFQKM
ncbi:Hypothetical_protein [Hexamita inflata]|uniref:Hypothetical_protein n=1 Tax=Hexamita inflata TaxID=28002 RepID=A0AA86N925_9EUKA|nr:Hypothetical protein HINF_LOCUS2284 [Hexamita inflata]